MLDNRIYTFLELCSSLNYHKTAEILNMTQPAVTQHIKYLENLYQCKLFDYSNRKLIKTEKASQLERNAREMIALNISVKANLLQKEKIHIKIGATKTIGEYKLDFAIYNLLSCDDYEVDIIIDNTENLLNKLNHFELDVLLLEGFIDKDKYLYKKISTEEILGLCSTEHPFAGREVELEDIIKEKVIFREKGSGTRKVFETFLLSQGYTTESFKNQSTVSNNRLIEHIVQNNLAISFVYEIISKSNDKLTTFKIKNYAILHEFNYVFLDKKKAEKIIDKLVFQ